MKARALFFLLFEIMAIAIMIVAPIADADMQVDMKADLDRVEWRWYGEQVLRYNPELVNQSVERRGYSNVCRFNYTDYMTQNFTVSMDVQQNTSYVVLLVDVHDRAQTPTCQRSCWGYWYRCGRWWCRGTRCNYHLGTTTTSAITTVPINVTVTLENGRTMSAIGIARAGQDQLVVYLPEKIYGRVNVTVALANKKGWAEVAIYAIGFAPDDAIIINFKPNISVKNNITVPVPNVTVEHSTADELAMGLKPLTKTMLIGFGAVVFVMVVAMVIMRR